MTEVYLYIFILLAKFILSNQYKRKINRIISNFNKIMYL